MSSKSIVKVKSIDASPKHYKVNSFRRIGSGLKPSMESAEVINPLFVSNGGIYSPKG